MNARTSVAALMIFAGAASCEDAEPPERAVPEAESSSTRWTKVESGQDHGVVQAPARLVATATSSAEVTFLAAGVVRRVFVRPGDAVEAGAPLLEIASPSLAEAAGEWRSAVETLEIAEDRLERLVALAEERIASRDDLQARREDVARLRGRRRQLQAMLRAHGVEPKQFDAVHRSGSLVIESPVDGTVTDLTVRLGQAVGADRGPLATVVGAGRPRVEALMQSEPGEGLRYVFAASTGERYAVRTPPVGSVSDSETGTWTTWFELAEDVRIVGERVGELVGSAEGDDVFTIAVEALGRSAEGAFVARDGGERTAARVEVEVLHQDDHVAVIRGDLSAGERVALDPRATLRAADR